MKFHTANKLASNQSGCQLTTLLTAVELAHRKSAAAQAAAEQVWYTRCARPPYACGDAVLWKSGVWFHQTTSMVDMQWSSCVYIQAWSHIMVTWTPFPVQTHGQHGEAYL